MTSGGYTVEASQELEGLLLHNKPARMLIKIKEGGGKKYASVLAKEVDCTYSHCVRLLKKLENLGIVKFNKNGRIKSVKLTKYGEDIAIALENLYRAIERKNK